MCRLCFGCRRKLSARTDLACPPHRAFSRRMVISFLVIAEVLVLLPVQRRAYATGLDTGCCYGDRLSAAILPSMRDLRAAQQSQSGSTLRPSLDPQDIKIISVPAHEKYYEDHDPCS